MVWRSLVKLAVASGIVSLLGLSISYAQEDRVTSDEPPPVAHGTLQPGFTHDEEQRPVPSRFGAPAPDSAFGAFQRGLFLTARNLAVPRAKEGDAAAQTLLGEIYSRGLGVAADFEEAEKWYAMAAEQGVAEAQLQVALAELSGESGSERGRELMRAAADAGHAQAAFVDGAFLCPSAGRFSA